MPGFLKSTTPRRSSSAPGGELPFPGIARPLWPRSGDRCVTLEEHCPARKWGQTGPVVGSVPVQRWAGHLWSFTILYKTCHQFAEIAEEFPGTPDGWGAGVPSRPPPGSEDPRHRVLWCRPVLRRLVWAHATRRRSLLLHHGRPGVFSHLTRVPLVWFWKQTHARGRLRVLGPSSQPHAVRTGPAVLGQSAGSPPSPARGFPSRPGGPQACVRLSACPEGRPCPSSPMKLRKVSRVLSVSPLSILWL